MRLAVCFESRSLLVAMRTLLSAVLALAVAGCSEELGPARGETTRLQGRVTLRGHPVTRGWLEFEPIAGTIGASRSARLDANGLYQLDRVPIGRVAFRVMGGRLRDPYDRNLDKIILECDRGTFAYRTTIGRGQATFDVELADRRLIGRD